MKIITEILDGGWLLERGLRLDDWSAAGGGGLGECERFDVRRYPTFDGAGIMLQNYVCSVGRTFNNISSEDVVVYRSWSMGNSDRRSVADPSGGGDGFGDRVCVPLGDPDCFVKVRDLVEGFVND